jgi:hypothetical protein
MAPEHDLEEVLRQLEREEHEVSLHRSTIHERLSSFSNSALEEQERRLSARRRELHAEIDRIKALLKEQPGDD